MTNFEIKGYYRFSKDSARVINNNIMTDELAVEFLKIDPTRIRLFTKYPSNWEELIGEKPEAKQEDEAVVDGAFKEELSKYKMKELREMYPTVPQSFGISKKEFIIEILKHQGE